MAELSVISIRRSKRLRNIPAEENCIRYPKQEHIIDSTIGTRDWSSLPGELVGHIAKRIYDINDFVRFGAVCRPWQFVTSQRKLYYLAGVDGGQSGQVPWLMLAASKRSRKKNFRQFYCLLTNKIFSLNLPELQDSFCFGSSFGWMISISHYLNAKLVHPLTHAQIQLPTNPMLNSHMGSMHIKKAILSSNPSDSNANDVVVFIIIPCRHLVFARPGDTRWTCVAEINKVYRDVLYFNGECYAVTHMGQLEIFDSFGPTRNLTVVIPQPEIFSLGSFSLRAGTTNFLVEIGGALHMVIVLSKYRNNNYVTEGFELYKARFCARAWEQLSSLGDYALFYSANASFALSASKYPRLKGNCVYFSSGHTNYFGVENCDMGIFDFTTGAIEPIGPGFGAYPPITGIDWLSPSLL